MTLTDRLKLIAADVLERYRPEIDQSGVVYQVNLTIKVSDKSQLPFKTLVGIERSHEVEGVRVN